MFFFSTIKTRNSTIHFSFLVPHRTSLVEVMLLPHAPKNLNYYDAYVSAWAWFLLYFVQERVPRVIPFRLSKTNQADHMCLEHPLFDPQYTHNVVLYDISMRTLSIFHYPRLTMTMSIYTHVYMQLYT